jgi:type III secretory pathway lipoprotein EscJ|tara:strand:+ start:1097 stop:1756 length:660 start_codon:yes stop_codon:yes gene_type:complete
MADLTSLETSLLAAKQFMNHEKMQVNGKGNTMTQPTRPLQEVASAPVQFPQNTPMPNTPPPSPSLSNLKPHSTITEESIRQSNLPPAIKEAMIKHPIPDIQTGADLNPDFIDKVAQKMNDSDYTIQGMRNTANSTLQQPLTESTPQIKKSPIPSPTRTLESSDLKNEIKTLISESLDELIENKINKVLMESKNVKENIHFRVGNKIFTGKISKVKTLKS